MRIDRIWSMPNKNTFLIKPIKELLEEEVNSDVLSLDPYANQARIAKITNDLNPEFDTDYHMDALDFLKMFDNESVDLVLLDWPYSARQVSECYKGFGYKVTKETTQSSFYSRPKKEVARILKHGGKVICFGWNSNGVGKTLGFEMTRMLLVPHGGNHYDTIVTVEIKK